MNFFSIKIHSKQFLAQGLIEMGEALREMAEIKYALEDNVKQNFLEPLTHLQCKDLKDVMVLTLKLITFRIFETNQLVI